MDAPRLEPGLLRELAQDEERARARERAALRVQEELRPVPAVEKGPAPGEIAAEGVDGAPSERHDALLAALAHGARAARRGRRRLARARPPRSRAGRRRRGARRGRGPSVRAGSFRPQRRRGVPPRPVRACAAIVARVGGARSPQPDCPRGNRGEARGGRVRAPRPRDVRLSLPQALQPEGRRGSARGPRASRARRRALQPGAQGVEVAAVRLDRPRRKPGGRDRKKPVDLRSADGLWS